MVQNKKRIISLILMLTLLVSSLVIGTVTTASATTSNTSSSGEYVKVTSAPSDWSGTYLIVYEDGKVAFNGALTKHDASFNTVGVEISDGKIAATEELKKFTFTIEKSGSNYTIKSASGKYIGNNSNSNSLTSSDTALNNTITLNGTNVDIKSSGGAYLRYNATSGQERFRYFKSGTYTNQKAIQLYKYVESGSSGHECKFTGDWVITDTQHSRKCTVEGCNKESTPVNHDFNIFVSSTDATCVNAGTITNKCECGKTDTTTTTPATGEHNYEDGTCSSCGADDPNYNAGGDDGEKDELVTVEIVISDVATKNSWTNQSKYTSFSSDNVNFSVSSGTNTGKYYSSDKSWRIYSSENATLTISVPEGNNITSVAITFSEGGLKYGSNAINNGVAFDTAGNQVVITATTKTFITKMVVTYVAENSSEGGETPNPEAPTCTHENTTETTIPATCTTDGSVKVTCGDCGETISNETIKASGHSYTEEVTVEATCTTAGVKTFTCQNDNSHTKEEVIPATGHNYVDGICSCGAKKPNGYVAITSADQLVSGKYILVVSSGYAPTKYEGGWVQTYKTSANDNLVDAEAFLVWTLTVEGEYVYLQDSNGTYIAPSGGNVNGITTGEYKWEWTCVDGEFIFAGIGKDTVYLASNGTDNSGDNKFRAYKTSTVNGNAKTYLHKFTLYTCDHKYDNNCDTTCNVCGATRTITHSPANAVRENEVPATCVNAGSYELATYCTVCEVELSRETKTIDKLAHSAACGHSTTVVDGVYYESIVEALAAANKAEKTIVLTKDVVLPKEYLELYVTLDLAGHRLHVAGLFNNGRVVDTSAELTGVLIVNDGGFTFEGLEYQDDEGNQLQVPVCVARRDGFNEFVFRTPKAQNKAPVETEASVVIAFRPSFAGGNYTNIDLFADGSLDNDVKFEIRVTRTGADGTKTVQLPVSQEVVVKVYSATNRGFRLTVTGAEEGYTYNIELVIYSCGVTVHNTVLAIIPAPVNTGDDDEQVNA